MELNINSPAYYSKEFGVDDDIYLMCREISKIMRDKTYSELINIVGIVPIIAPKELISQGCWKEDLRFDTKYKTAYVSKQIDFDLYKNSNISGRKKLIIENIISSIKSIKRRGRFDSNRFEQDLLDFYKQQ